MVPRRLSIVLRLTGENLGRGWSALIAELRPDRVWTAGDSRPGGRPYETSGFSVLLAESENSNEAVEMAHVAFQGMAERVSLLITEGARGEVDCGLMIGIDAPMASLRLAHSFAKIVSERGLDFLVSFYSTSD
jgi:hypothetical protein